VRSEPRSVSLSTPWARATWFTEHASGDLGRCMGAEGEAGGESGALKTMTSKKTGGATWYFNFVTLKKTHVQCNYVHPLEEALQGCMGDSNDCPCWWGGALKPSEDEYHMAENLMQFFGESQ